MAPKSLTSKTGSFSTRVQVAVKTELRLLHLQGDVVEV